MLSFIRPAALFVTVASLCFVGGLYAMGSQNLAADLANVGHALLSAGQKFRLNFDPCMGLAMFGIILFANKMAGGSLTNELFSWRSNT